MSLSWGVIVTGQEKRTGTPQEALFRGWYATRAEAEEVFTEKSDDYPNREVSLVKRDAWREAGDAT